MRRRSFLACVVGVGGGATLDVLVSAACDRLAGHPLTGNASGVGSSFFRKAWYWGGGVQYGLSWVTARLVVSRLPRSPSRDGRNLEYHDEDVVGTDSPALRRSPAEGFSVVSQRTSSSRVALF